MVEYILSVCCMFQYCTGHAWMVNCREQGSLHLRSCWHEERTHTGEHLRTVITKVRRHSWIDDPSVKSTGCFFGGLFQRTHMVSHSCLCLQFRGSEAVFWPPPVPGMRVMHIQTCKQKINTCKTKVKMNLKTIRIRKLRVDQREETRWQLSACLSIPRNSDT